MAVTESSRANLVPGQPGNRGGGRPKSQVRDMAAHVYEECLEEFLALLDSHRRHRASQGTEGKQLTPGELSKVSAEVKTIGVGEIKEVSVEKEAFLQCCADAIEATCKTNELPGHIGLDLYDAIVARCKDV